MSTTEKKANRALLYLRGIDADSDHVRKWPRWIVLGMARRCLIWINSNPDHRKHFAAYCSDMDKIESELNSTP